LDNLRGKSPVVFRRGPSVPCAKCGKIEETQKNEIGQKGKATNRRMGQGAAPPCKTLLVSLTIPDQVGTHVPSLLWVKAKEKRGFWNHEKHGDTLRTVLRGFALGIWGIKTKKKGTEKTG